MKKVFLVFSFALIFVLNSQLVFAHPPSDIKISYDAATKTLKAVIIHAVSDINKHYIGKVDIGLNGKEIISHHISFQETGESQAVSYYISDIKPGDKLSVEGYCSISGKFEKEIKVAAK